MAHNLGLQVDISEVDGKTSMTEEEIEVRRVTWWGCYVVDKYVLLGSWANGSCSLTLHSQVVLHRLGKAE